jgi:hypothetical protein
MEQKFSALRPWNKNLVPEEQNFNTMEQNLTDRGTKI